MLPFSLKTFTLKLKLARKIKRLHQWQIANIMGISRELYAKYETAACEPNFTFLYNLSLLYGVPTDVFIDPNIPAEDIVKHIKNN